MNERAEMQTALNYLGIREGQGARKKSDHHAPHISVGLSCIRPPSHALSCCSASHKEKSTGIGSAILDQGLETTALLLVLSLAKL